MKKLNIVIFGLAITSSWGNGHATTYRSLVKALNHRGHKVAFFERDTAWYAAQRDLPHPSYCKTYLYQSAEDLNLYETLIGQADLVILGSSVPDAEQLFHKISALSPTCFAFYDLDTPVTLKTLGTEQCSYLTADMIPGFDVYLSFTGGPTLERLQNEYGAKHARSLYCSVDPELYFPETVAVGLSEKNYSLQYALGYLGNYCADRQPTVQKLLIDTAHKASESKFCIAGAKYPVSVRWPTNTKVFDYIPPYQHRHFYNSQWFTLNITRQDMITAGYSPSVRLFEAGACGTPIISDYWNGLDSFFAIGEEILVAHSTEEVLDYMHMHQDDRLAIGRRMWQKVHSHHTSAQRALEIEAIWDEIVNSPIIDLAAHHRFKSHQAPIRLRNV